MSQRRRMQVPAPTVRSRLAPTPSGLLHLGNGVNVVVTWVLTRAAGGVLRLRIDDADQTRARPEYVEDIFRQLDWLGLDWDEGPTGPTDFLRRHSQFLRRDRYRFYLERLVADRHVYWCRCSRKEIRAKAPTGPYPGTCRGRHERGGGAAAARVTVPVPTEVPVDGVTVPLCRTLGDFVLWRKEDLPAYQLASLADDLDHGTNLVVRGEDLLPSTGAQLFLAGLLGTEGQTFLSARFIHHPLVTGKRGEKLAKSKGSLTLAAMRRDGTGRDVIYRRAARMLTLDPARARSLADLVALYREQNGV